ATCIIVLRKSKKENKTLFIDASNLFVHEGNKNKLSPDNIAAIVDEYADRKVVPHFSAIIDNKTIAENGYNLSVSSYVEAEDSRPQTDIRELNARIARIVEHENRLRAEIDAIIRELEEDSFLSDSSDLSGFSDFSDLSDLSDKSDINNSKN
ncbi:MAG: N-6 DNA methylase, partial [Muribaculaceae bacterium]|nr:N-6 DNA methylase [Muribaculaceae bacterium]